MGIAKLVLISAICFVLISPAAFADRVILKTGEIIETKQAWKKDQKVYFYIDDLKLSVSIKEVLRIENHSDTTTASSHISDPPEPPPSKHIHKSAKENSSNKKCKLPKNPSLTGSPKKIHKPMISDGFRDLPWGAELIRFTDFVKLETDSGIKDVREYKRINDKLTLGQADIQSIVYAFWRDQFYTVTIWAEGEKNYLALRDYSVNQFGKNYHYNNANRKYLWSDTLTDAMLKYDETEQLGYLWMRSKKIDRLYKLTRLNVPSSYRKWTKSRN